MNSQVRACTEAIPMADVGEFAHQVGSYFRILQQSFATQPELNRLALALSDETVEKFVKAVYYASLIPDEGRWPRATLICYPADVELQFHLLFDQPLDVSPSQIAKLSHAIDNRTHIACSVKDRQIKIAGLHVNWLATQREHGFGSRIAINQLKTTINGPGNIEATTDVITLVYRGGVISSSEQLIRAKTMARLIARLRQELHDAGFDTRLDSLPGIINELMGAIVRLGHGGMVIFTGEPKAPQFSSLRRTNCFFLHQLLTAYWQRRLELVSAAGGLERWLENADMNGLAEQRMNVASATDRLENCVQAIANLSGMDGAIVLTYGCNVGAFNAIIDRQTEPQAAPRLIDVKGKEIDYQKAFGDRGSRHQAALLYARSVPDSFVFVISQDGSISAFHNPNDGTVVCEFGLRPME
jgi:hypothetical protein